MRPPAGSTTHSTTRRTAHSTAVFCGAERHRCSGMCARRGKRRRYHTPSTAPTSTMVQLTQ